MHSEIAKYTVNLCYSTHVAGTLMLNLKENKNAMGSK